MSMIKPIHKIPRDGSSLPLWDLISEELKGRPVVSLAEQLEALHSHSQDENHLEVCMDWAMELRSLFGLSWTESIDAAMILYFG